MIILKFGGTSVSSKKRIRTICSIVEKQTERQPIVVVSAIRGVTDLLISSLSAGKKERKEILKKIESIHANLIVGEKDEEEIKNYIRKKLDEIEDILDKKERSKEVFDLVVSYGEIMSSFLISKFIQSFGISSQQVIATSLIMTNENFTNADFLPEATQKKAKRILNPLVGKKIVPVVTGFIGATKNSRVTTLGRGGSDYSASIIGFCLNAQEVQIWTDVDGVYSADPRMIDNARHLERITYKEASELAAFGAKVLHPRTIKPLIARNIPVVVKNTFNPDAAGTYINGKLTGVPRITAIASKPSVALVNIYSDDMLYSRGFLEKIFSVFSKYGISVDLVSVSEVSVSVTLDNKEELASALAELRNFAAVSTNQVGVVSLIGENILENEGVLKNVFSTLNSARIPVKMLSLGASDINISIVTDPGFVLSAVESLHDRIIFQKHKERINL